MGRKGVFVHVHKCGGGSIKTMLYGRDGEARRGDVYTLAGPLHTTGNKYNRRYRWEIDDWHDRFKFAFIRNPFDRLVSAFRFFRGYVPLLHPWKYSGTFSEFVELATDPMLPSNVVHGELVPLVSVKTHTMPLVSEGYYLQFMDFIGRYETFRRDVRYVMGELGLAHISVPHGHKTASAKTPHYSFYFKKARTRELAEQYYWPDCEAYDYRFEEAA